MPLFRPSPLPRTRPLTLRNAASFGVGYLYSSDASGSKTDTPDHASLDILGDIDLRILVAFHDYDELDVNVLVAKGDTNSASADHSFQFSKVGVSDGTKLFFHWRNSSDVLVTQESDTALTVATPRWYRVTLDVDDGSGNRVITFYFSDQPVDTDPASVTWTTHSIHTVAGTTSIQTSVRTVRAGITEDSGVGNRNPLHGQIYYAEIRDGIAGTVVANPDFRWRTDYVSKTSLTDQAGKVWTITAVPAVNGWWVLPLQGGEPAGGAATVTPATVVTTSTVPTPTILVPATVTPAVIPVVAVLPTPSILAAARVTPAVVAVTAALSTPTVLAAATVTPATVAVTAALPTPTVLAAALVATAVVPLTVSLPTPTIRVDVVATPAVVAVVVTLPTPAIVAAATVTPATTTAVAALPVPTVLAAATVTQATIVTAAALPPPGDPCGGEGHSDGCRSSCSTSDADDSHGGNSHAIDACRRWHPSDPDCHD